MTTPHAAFEFLNRSTGAAPLPVPEFEGSEPQKPDTEKPGAEKPLESLATPFRLATAAASALAFGAAAAGEIWRFRGGEKQTVRVDLAAACASLSAPSILRRNGSPIPPHKDETATTGFYQSADRRWLYMRGGFPHLVRRTLELLNAKDNAKSVGEAVSKWNGLALEDAIGFLGLAGAVVRSADEWRAIDSKTAAPITLTKIGEAPPFRPEHSATPLGGLRVLGLTRLIAGEAATWSLAAHGAEVLTIRSPRHAYGDEAAFAAGKHSRELDLAKPGDAEALRQLVRESHIFVDSHRPGALAKLGFSPATLAHTAPGIVTVSLGAYSGSWAPRRGFEAVVQAASGLAAEQGAYLAAKRGRPHEALPALIGAPVLCTLTGYLAAAGAMAAVLRRIREGGSWHVEVSLSATAAWLMSLGRIDAAAMTPRDGLDPYLYSCETKDGWFELLGPVVRMDKTPLLKGVLPDRLDIP
ncbi:MAG: CoA transferase [Rhizomicrobium sp.]|nr:CoA transferase [Rhizomicrobium sp.]